MFLMSTEEKNMEKKYLQRLKNAIKKNFSGDNQREAKNTAKEILNNTPKAEQKAMIKFLTETINGRSIFDRLNYANEEIPKSSPSHTQER